ncbi:MAG: twin transmembrane helix small protein [Bauldia sp.]|nr:twin transmembrane helix small protein [Bauldia sp.]
MTFLQILALIAIGVVVIVLGLGLWNLMRNGSPQLSQKLMRARVLVQLIALIIMMTALYFAQNSAS